MCCSGEHCFRVCHCICNRCRKCLDCKRQFGRGSIAMNVMGDKLGSLAGGIVRQDNQRFFNDPYNMKKDPLKFNKYRNPYPIPDTRTELSTHLKNACVVM